MAVFVDDHVVWLKISVYNIPLVKISEGYNDFSDVKFGLVFGEWPPCITEHGLQISSWAEVDDEKQLGP